MKDVPTDVIERFVDACHEIADRRLVRCSCGSLSMRVNETCFLTTGSGTWMDRLTRYQVAICRTEDGASLNRIDPGNEVPFHTGIFKVRPDVNVVLRFQTPCATALACRPVHDTDYSVIPEVPYYIGPIAHVPYLTPDSDDLTQAITQAMVGHDMAQITNIGQVTATTDVDDAIRNAEIFELACEIALLGGIHARPMKPTEVETLRLMRGRRATW